MKKLLILSITALLLGCTTTMKQDTMENEAFTNYTVSGKIMEDVRVVEVKAKKFYFDPEVIVVDAGERVRIKLEAMDTDHGFAIDEVGFDLRGKKGMVVEGEFTAPKPGAYQIKCSVYCGAGHSSMRGTLVVK